MMTTDSRIKPDWSGKTILIAEDTETSIMFYMAALKKTKAKLLQANNGKETVEFVKSGEKIDLILMDINMPEMDGLEAAEEIKKLKPNLPIIIQTAYVLNEERIRSFEAGCDGFIAKPVKIYQLIETIQSLI